MVNGHRNVGVFPEHQAELRRQRLILSVTGGVAFCGLAVLAHHYTAPFADPPDFAASVRATAIAAPGAVAPTPGEKADVALAAEPAEPPAAPVETAPAAPRESVADAVDTVDTAATEPIEVLDSNDPRWGSSFAAPNPAPAVAPGVNGELAYAAGDPAADALKRAVVDGTTDSTETSAIPQPRPAIEAIRPEQPDPVEGRAAMRTATIASAVNMRARGAKGSRVLGVIPQGATVGLVDCDGWCEVIYDGRRGFIYKSFIEGPDRTAEATQAEEPGTPSRPKIVPPVQNDIDNLGR